MIRRHGRASVIAPDMLILNPKELGYSPSRAWKLLMIKRRELIMLLGGAAARRVLGPLPARAQQPAMPVIGFLDPSSPDTNEGLLRAFRQGLKETGYVEGENVAVSYCWAEDQIDRLSELAADLARRQVAVIATFSNGVFAAKSATTTIPIVFVVSDNPVRVGLVASLARPGGNLTGVNFLNAQLSPKRLELLHELLPAATRVAVLVRPTNSGAEATLRDMDRAARGMGLQIEVFNAGNGGEIDSAFETFARQRPDALFVCADTFFRSRRMQLAHLATRHSVPATYSVRDYAEAGGLMSYGASLTDAYRQVGAYAGRILKGAKPADLPVIQASKFELVINAQTARMLGVTVPPMLLARADEVIE
jgi:putative tryptophan/tyrosine transport system substrate-binding protein